MKLKPGQKAPPFETIDQAGNPVSLSALAGKKFALVFYPRDNSPTCTTQVCNLRDHYDQLSKAGISLFGVSPDSQKKHQNFINKFNLPFPILVDSDLNLIKKYQVWGPKKVFGKDIIGVYRTTFIIDEKGIIAKIIDEVKAKDHAKQILAN